jgi:peptidoglycan/LPS O-acetylase OafA/YrhL
VGLDLVVVLAFVAIGRANHHHGETAAGLASTAWPFLVGLACGWALLVARRRPGDRLVDGVAVALVTVAVGMVLRVLAGQGTAAAFIVVAVCFLGACMVGWRAVGLLARRRRRAGA